MGKKAVQLDETYIFPDRFMTLCSTERKTLEEWGHIFLVTRQTISNWQTGKSIPSIVELMRIMEYFHVSADYLLGLSDTATPDVSARAAIEYTGLSEAAVERLHIGIREYECDGEVITTADPKRFNLNVASEFIQSDTFADIIHYLGDVLEDSYLERILSILNSQYCVCSEPQDAPYFSFARKEDRDVVEAHMIYLFRVMDSLSEKDAAEKVRSLDDEQLWYYVDIRQEGTQENNELHQFHAAKVFNRYLDHLIKRGQNKAEERFKKK